MNRWRSFSLRAILLLVTLAACFLGEIGMRLHQARQQRVAVSEIVKTGGMFEYGYAYHEIGRPKSGAKPNGPQWLR